MSAESPSLAGSAPRGWGAAAWQLPPNEHEWPEHGAAPDGSEPDKQPADYSADLAASFATWRTDPQWQPPQLPRFGPPAPPDPGEPEHIEDTGAFAQDDFLR